MVIKFNQLRLLSLLFTNVHIKQVITNIKICYLHYQELTFTSTYILFTLNVSSFQNPTAPTCRNIV